LNTVGDDVIRTVDDDDVLGMAGDRSGNSFLVVDSIYGILDDVLGIAGDGSDISFLVSDDLLGNAGEDDVTDELLVVVDDEGTTGDAIEGDFPFPDDIKGDKSFCENDMPFDDEAANGDDVCLEDALASGGRGAGEAARFVDDMAGDEDEDVVFLNGNKATRGEV